MATSNAAVEAVRALGLGQSQESLADQALEAVPVVEAMGLHDLADHLRQLAGATKTAPPADIDVPVHGCCGCSCHVCENGHDAVGPEHTDACAARFFARVWDQSPDHNI